MFVLMLDLCFKSFDYMKALVGKVKAIKMIAKHDVQHNFDALFVGYFLISQSWYCWPCSNANLYLSGFDFQNNGYFTCDTRKQLVLSYCIHVKLKDYKLLAPHLLEDL